MSGWDGPSRLDPQAICPASGLTNEHCMRSLCDCFPDAEDRFGLHPDRLMIEPQEPPESFWSPGGP